MTVEYDLVIIGDSIEALTAAREAQKFPARVALVVPSEGCDIWLNRQFYQLTLLHNPSLLKHGSNLARELTLTQQKHLAELAAGGIDIVIGKGEFVRLPSLAFVVQQRRLRSRTYLIATGSYPTIPPIDGLESVSYLTSLDFWQKQDLEYIPSELTLIGTAIDAVEMAQCLNNQGKKITLITKDSQLLPQFDPEASRILQAKLEVQGIKIFNASPVTQIKKIDSKKWLQAGDHALETDDILVIPISTPNISDLNLAGIGVDLTQRKISVNKYLQTSNPRIYACGELITEQASVQLAQYQAKIAVNNALILRKLVPDYHTIPQVVFTQPQLASVGLTEAEARRIYGQKVDILHNYYHNITLAQIKDQTSGLSKIIIKTNGQILGAHFVGVDAVEMIGSMAIAMETQLNIKQLAFKFPAFTMSQIIHQTALNWPEKQENPWLETILSWRRSWLS
ncbi:NAD(P)/FAD-dependent oxidoreductase [Gloeocapsa sp. PCC 73106]|uniref:FAD-dependent oxidoreductase n=1 Tax=Gloeocapsa sp. PCC 73106 TaxID=102232 RepID=UPI0002AB9DD8|nr:NAD(P)/FAD-dependent oxidoreductase [Gloeocapsa sp. PCC 73106]ELR96484.1 pyruvate/2-oxoglutarate dehydrogenase complex, dihydrolipoamide dehydrogenase component [Gloeocapsa sp. PCC 73106]